MNERLREYHYLMIKNFAEDEILQNQTRHKIQDMKWIPYKDNSSPYSYSSPFIHSMDIQMLRLSIRS